MNYRRSACLLLIVSWLVAGCSLFPPPREQIVIPTTQASPVVITAPEIISHPKPALMANTQLLKEAGCVQNEYISWSWDCKGNAQLMALGCENVIPDDLLAGLTPAYSVMRCQQRSGVPPHRERFEHVGCLAPAYTSYVLFKGSEYQLITEEAELQAMFAPVDSVDEALSYALVAKDLSAYYDLKDDSLFSNARYFVDKFEATHVEETARGFIVHLFTDLRPPCGCGEHKLYGADILVTHDGHVEQVSATEILSVEACID
ncbi:MAG: hypothetical protein U0559_17305 [Anaerolineae bacterium]